MSGASPPADDDKELLLADSPKEDPSIMKFPYLKTRLKKLNWKEIVARGDKWCDPTFPHGPQALFINGVKH